MTLLLLEVTAEINHRREQMPAQPQQPLAAGAMRAGDAAA
jgi:hypothetical protein